MHGTKNIIKFHPVTYIYFEYTIKYFREIFTIYTLEQY
jgi:hypothetical protein